MMFTFAAGTLVAQNLEKPFSIGVEGGYFASDDENLKDLYGTGNVVFGGNIGYKIAKNLELISGVNFYSDEGQTSLTEENIKLKLTHLRFGGFYSFTPEGFSTIAGVGLDVCFVSEDNPISNFSDTSVGWFAAIGAETPLSADIRASLMAMYIDVDSEGDLGDISVGGFQFLFSVKLQVF